MRIDIDALTARTWWHGSRRPLGEVDWNHPRQGGLHLGSAEQARHRGPHLTPFRLLPGAHLVRTRDAAGGWVAKAQRHRATAEGLVYLNRHEGLSFEDIPSDWDDLDRIPDALFAKRVPRAGLSLLIIRPHAVQRLAHKEIAHG
jgi:hypothetical protein